MSDPALTNDEKEALRAWLYEHNGDNGGGLGGLWDTVERILADRDARPADGQSAAYWKARVEAAWKREDEQGMALLKLRTAARDRPAEPAG